MRFRPANIRLINRRSNLPRLLLALSSKKGKSNDKNDTTDVQRLTGSLHIRACFINGRCRWARSPQGLKPLVIPPLFGTTEVMPCYKADL